MLKKWTEEERTREELGSTVGLPTPFEDIS